MRSNEDWIRALSGNGESQDEAINDLRQFLLQAALYTLSRYLADLRLLSHPDRIALAEDCAQEALMAVLDHLDDFKGESKFTTWAYKFAANVSMGRARREGLEQFQPGNSANTIHPNWHLDKTWSANPDAELQVLQAEVIAVLNEAIQRDLSEKQRIVFRMIVFEQYPMDGVVQHLGSNRNAVYKLLHDARKKLKRALQDHGFGTDEARRLFGK